MISQAILTSYEAFIREMQSLTNITDEEGYQSALEAAESLLELSGEKGSNHYELLIDQISKAIRDYEIQNLKDVSGFVDESMSLPADRAALIVLMEQHQLELNDMPEIGKKSMVSQVLRGKRKLSREAIEKLSKRFGVSQSFFLE